MTHLLLDELRRWRDQGEEVERAHVLGHLALCDECRRTYAELVREQVPLDARADAPRPGRGGARWTVWGILGLAAALLVGWAIPWRPDGRHGDDIQLIAPVGAVSGPVVFRWSSPVSAARYRVWVHGEGSTVVYSTLATVESADPPPDVTGRFRPGRRYRWQVEAYDSGGALLMRSPERDFTLER